MPTHRGDSTVLAQTGRIITDPRTRAYLYGIAAAAVPVLVILGVLTDEDSGPWLLLVAAVLGTGTPALALVNTPKRADRAVRARDVVERVESTGGTDMVVAGEASELPTGQTVRAAGTLDPVTGVIQ